ncbi:MAG: deoxyguanosinetriphosphate triphosphohydrolase [Proteobacteria bacterium]|nr:deoxyguanosinetriphosphate triphosphohydrolase [Pseudomonadota bacterium]MBU1234777.1 deoxyguanosinetriphosphate triphosphohydrolase [Pseudomonadota bacterium]MBU1417309.1 deoxyguanosinetriphosphate triphosphohydrolase [Pseudomonadota bacterium]MBU1456513.1 deoxyguanosinetriphosphate triphosphohydrolase [Pseudomonadota bacterium]
MAYTPVVGRSIRRQLENREEEILSPYAALNKNSAGRRVKEEDDERDIRMPFQRDRDRITHSKTFRRLKHKTQVFLAPAGDHYRTRLTHVLEVSQIARTVASALCLNSSLTEAIALGHDLGHTPFGHAGEATLNELHPGGFRHYIHSLRVVDFLENRGRGLNLTFEVRNGIVKHSKGRNDILPENSSELPETLEGQVVRLADIIAYVNHDMDDAQRAGILKEADLPADIRSVLGERHSKRTGAMVRDLIIETLAAGDGRLHLSKKMLQAISDLRMFLYENVYRFYLVHDEFEKAQRVIRDLYAYFMENGLGHFNGQSWESLGHGSWPSEDLAHRRVCDFIAGMTDRYALRIYEQIFLPKPWNARGVAF